MVRTGRRGAHRRALSLRSGLAGLAAVVVSVCVGAAVMAGSASAAQPVTTVDTEAYLCPGSAPVCTSVAYGLTRIPRNSPVTMVCWVDVAGRGGRWYNVKVGPYDVFVKAERISNPVRTPFCPQVPTVQASLWGTAAEQQVGRTATFPSDATVRRAQTLPLSVDNWGPRRDWSGDCIAFAWLAIDSVGHKNGIRGGLRTATAQGLAGPLHPGLMPPRGALVFWRGGTGDVGHVAISLGSGWVATTNGYDTSPSPQANSVKKLNDVRLPYLGWRAFTELPR